jgi:hypothetical protein
MLIYLSYSPLEDPSWLANRGQEYHAFAILTMCRALHALEHGTIVSKPTAARWAQERLSGKWSQVIEQSLAAQKPDAGTFDLFDQAIELIRYTQRSAEV